MNFLTSEIKLLIANIPKNKKVTKNQILQKPLLLLKHNNKLPALNIQTCILTQQETMKKSMNCVFDIGDLTITFYESMMLEICNLINIYTKIRLLRDFSICKKIEEINCQPEETGINYRGNQLHFLADSHLYKLSQEDEDLKLNQIFDTLKLNETNSLLIEKPKRLFLLLDKFLLNGTLKTKISLGNLTISFFDSRKQSNVKATILNSVPFFNLIAPPTNFIFQGTAEKSITDIGGIKITCTKPASIISVFLDVFLNNENY